MSPFARHIRARLAVTTAALLLPLLAVTTSPTATAADAPVAREATTASGAASTTLRLASFNAPPDPQSTL
jgi:hypothetical protein